MNEGQYQGMLDIWNEQAKSIKDMAALLKEIRELLMVRSVQPEQEQEKPKVARVPIVTKKPTKGN